ncbi:hypothetical protein KFL_006570060 [Klebsormidium nitens]|uniref:Glycosyltransferase n=1 Tax=Klebsormidium nitens TaxID=105231 RepID=A0A1Y1IN35_KLENI|nr:hypothetical protein KFL_006570060 [Klebsormidium nitens]|eukprot:GAQ90571.1 hypothetical protein KFL_006570060 [Klebsormidium nitens]
MDSERLGEMRALVIFARLPVPGKVKTRLAAGIGPEAAASFYKAMAEQIVVESAKCNTNIVRYLFHSEPNDREGVQEWMAALGQKDTLKLRVQSTKGDVGGRMRDAFEEVFKTGVDQVVLIGTDIPDLTADVMERAFKALETADVVLGPAADGGYYLIGLKRLHEVLFEGIPWSSSETRAATIAAAERAGLRVAPSSSLPTLADIDTLDDLENWYTSARTEVHVSPTGPGTVATTSTGPPASAGPPAQRRASYPTEHILVVKTTRRDRFLTEFNTHLKDPLLAAGFGRRTIMDVVQTWRPFTKRGYPKRTWAMSFGSVADTDAAWAKYEPLREAVFAQGLLIEKCMPKEEAAPANAAAHVRTTTQHTQAIAAAETLAPTDNATGRNLTPDDLQDLARFLCDRLIKGKTQE